ncbi:MAG: AAA family ATPase [Nocardioides sp.]
MLDTASGVLERALAHEPTLGEGRLICIDGPAGSGKTTLAAAIAEQHPGTQVVHVDDLLEGWQGLPGVAERLDPLLGPLSEGRPGSYRRFDWHANRLAESVAVTPAELVVIEGVGSGNRRHAQRCTVLVWVEHSDAEERLRRGMARDGEGMRDHWVQFMADEQRLFADEETRERADVIV